MTEIAITVFQIISVVASVAAIGWLVIDFLYGE